ncbi:hypothetical protein ACFPVT_02220 [Corynebacterium choanae]|nr:hypothetical protein [Corynebacterium choanae]
MSSVEGHAYTQQALNAAAVEALDFFQQASDADERMLFAAIASADLPENLQQHKIHNDPLTITPIEDFAAANDPGQFIAEIVWPPLVGGALLAQRIRFSEPGELASHPALLIVGVLRNGYSTTLLKILDDSVPAEQRLRGGQSIAPELIEALQATFR